MGGSVLGSNIAAKQSLITVSLCSSKNSTQHGGATRPESVERVVYVLPDDATWRSNDDAIDLARLWNTVWQNKWLITAVTAVIAVASIAYALTLTHWYRSEVLLAPADEQTI